MKKIASALLVIPFAISVYSDDYYWGNNSGSWWGNWGVNWSDENYVEKAHKPYATDNAIFDVNFMDYKINAEISTSEETVKDIIFQNHYTRCWIIFSTHNNISRRRISLRPRNC